MAEYIDREVMMAEIDDAMDADGMGFTVGCTVKRYLKRQPIADVAPVVHGQWIPDDDSWACSVCHEENACAYNKYLVHFDRYCPQCGAKMDGSIDNHHQQELWERLKAYEETGLTPERAQELADRLEKSTVKELYVSLLALEQEIQAQLEHEVGVDLTFSAHQRSGPNYRTVKALAAVYELQDYLAGEIADAKNKNPKETEG